jgi:hypothetical protein
VVKLAACTSLGPMCSMFQWGAERNLYNTDRSATERLEEESIRFITFSQFNV